jgi:hypothetical protein
MGTGTDEGGSRIDITYRGVWETMSGRAGGWEGYGLTDKSMKLWTCLGVWECHKVFFAAV